jgi:hypothetical protein
MPHPGNSPGERARASDAARRAFIGLAHDRGANFATWEAFRGSDLTVRDLEPLDGARAVLDVELSARHAAANTSASREARHGWEVMKSTERFGFGARSYRDPRFDDRRLQLSCRAVQDVQCHHFEASGMEAGAER